MLKCLNIFAYNVYVCLPISLEQLRGSDLKMDRSKNRSMWADLFPYIGIRSIFYRALHITIFKCTVTVEEGPIMA